MATSPKSFIAKLFQSHAFTRLSVGMSFPMSRMSSTYKTIKIHTLPLDLTYIQCFERITQVLRTFNIIMVVSRF